MKKKGLTYNNFKLYKLKYIKNTIHFESKKRTTHFFFIVQPKDASMLDGIFVFSKAIDILVHIYHNFINIATHITL